jgi:hypothetical protein
LAVNHDRFGFGTVKAANPWLDQILVTQPPVIGVRIRYDRVRASRRWLIALLLGIFWVMNSHGVSWLPEKYCNGGWSDAFEFFGEFLGALVLIEASQWVLWRIWGMRSLKNAPNGQKDAMFSGGRLLFVPQTLLWSLVFMGACFAVSKWAGSPDPCEAAMLSGRDILGIGSFACGVLGLSNLVNLPMFSSRSRNASD